MDNRACPHCDDTGLVIPKIPVFDFSRGVLSVHALICRCIVGHMALQRIERGSLREVSIGFNPPVMAPAQRKGE